MSTTLHQEIRLLLADWCDGLRRRQIADPDDPARDGGLFCPDCQIIHGRCGDAAYPFLRQARETGGSSGGGVDVFLRVETKSANR